MAASITTTATTLEGQALEITRALQAAEAEIPEEERPNRATIAVDPEAGEVTLTIQLPVSLSGAGGSLTFTADPYLT